MVIFPLFQDLETYRLRTVHQKVVRAAQTRWLATIDLLDVYASRAQKGTRLAHGGLHPTAAGNRLAARTIAGELRRR